MIKDLATAGRMIAALPSNARALIEPELPNWLEPRWFTGKTEAMAAAVGANIGWFDLGNDKDFAEVVRIATELKWVFTLLSGVDGLPLAELAARNIVLTNSPGLAAATVSEYVLLGMLSIAKGYRTMVRAQDRHEWLANPPGTAEITGSRALVVGYGAIGQTIEKRLQAFDIAVTVVRRNPSPDGHALGPDEWRARIGEFDWIILAAPATAVTGRMIGARELSAMKPSAVLLNVARGTLIDQDALVASLTKREIAAAFLDVTDPEPLPDDHPLWNLDNAHITMHLSGRSQTGVLERGSRRFLQNLPRIAAGMPPLFQVDLTHGY